MSFYLSLDDVPDLARGAAILGTGGGGDPLIGRLLVEECLKNGKKIEILDPTEIDDDDFVIATAMMGAPTVVVEKVPAGSEAVRSLRALEKHLGKTADATIPMECGGLNSMIPLVVAAEAGIPVVDGDGMGRAFPELQMETFGVYGVSGSPLAVSDENGHTCIVDTGEDNQRMETFARAVTIKMGGAAYIAEYPMSGADVKRTAIRNTVTLALNIGRTLRKAKDKHLDPLAELSAFLKDTIYGHGTVLMRGKIVDVERFVRDGFTQGFATVESFDGGDEMRIQFRNENVIAHKNGAVVAIVPDLITIVDVDLGTPITSEALRFGQRVAVYGISTPAIMRTPEALQVFGPQAFGLHEPWVALEELSAAR
ncbi:DUF917 domain-containing protein [Paenarthrobacter ureafaciens]|uniref:DUF917 domain-containing protein n=1 Tax=Paenarthrobacter ureafaciens TaxID=37931 RepID=UPI001C2BE8E3|nr:DUF917 domain-containing protein [Paenarthrobacter ureafaciens]